MATLRRFPLDFFLLLLLIFGMGQISVLGCSDFEDAILEGGKLPHNVAKPKMALRIDQPRRQDLDQFVHQLEPNIVLVNITGILTLRLDCWAPFPIDLQFTGHLTNQETTVKTFRKESGPKLQPRSCFIINATMESYEEITGNYTCSSVQNSSIFSSYYIFVSVNPPGVLLTRGQKISLQVKPKDKWIAFPCAVSHPDVHVQLLKDGFPVPLSPSLKYDPKLGFTMRIDTKDRSIYGSYSCQTELSPKDHVNITVLPPKNFEVHPPVNHIRLLPHGRLSVTCNAVDDFIITTTPPTIPFVKNEVKPNGSSSSHSSFYKYLGSFESEPLREKMSGYVACKWKRTNEPFAEWAFSVDPESAKPGHLDIKKFKTECPKDVEIIVYECSNVVECKINSCVRKDSKCQSNGYMCHKETCVRNGLVQCPSSGLDPVSDIFFTGYPLPSDSNQTNRYVQWEHAAEEEILMLKELPMSYPTTGEPPRIKYSCQGSGFVFSSGFKWSLIHGNGTPSTGLSTVEERSRHNVSVNNSWKEKKSNLESVLTLPLTSVMDSPHPTHIECSAPVWNSWRWISRRIPFDGKKFSLESFSGRRRPKGNSAATSVFSLKSGQWWWNLVLLLIPTLKSLQVCFFLLE